MRAFSLTVIYAILFVPLLFILRQKFLETENLFCPILFLVLNIAFIAKSVFMILADGRDELHDRGNWK